MKKTSKLIIFISFLMIIVLSTSSPVYARTYHNDKVVFGGSYRLESGDTLDGSLAVFGGQAVLEEDSTVTGDIIITGGTLDIYGEVEGDVTAIGGTVYLGDSAKIHGDVATVGSSLKRSEDADIRGNLTFNVPNDITIPSVPILPGLNFLTRPGSWIPSLNIDFEPIGKVMGALFQSIALAALAILVSLFLEKPTNRIVNSILAQPIVSGSIGLLSLVVIPGVLLVMAITLILIPISLLGFLGLFLSIIFGWVAIGFEVGNRMSTMFKNAWSAPVAAGIGTFTMTIVVKFFGWIPCIGWIIPTFVLILGLGGIILSRFGTRDYVSNKETESKPQKLPENISEGSE